MARERVGEFYLEGERFNGWRVWPVDGEESEARWFPERKLAIAFAQQVSNGASVP